MKIKSRGAEVQILYFYFTFKKVKTSPLLFALFFRISSVHKCEGLLGLHI